MPTPPKESIRGTKRHQIVSFEFTQKQFDYIVEAESFIESEEFQELPEIERSYILSEVDQQNFAYETLRLRVDSY